MYRDTRGVPWICRNNGRGQGYIRIMEEYLEYTGIMEKYLGYTGIIKEYLGYIWMMEEYLGYTGIMKEYRTRDIQRLWRSTSDIQG